MEKPATTMHVVIIDDTPVNLALMQALVGRIEGCVPTIYENPKLGLEAVLHHEPDLLIVDYMMPGLDGLQLMRRARAHFGDSVPILMVTAAHEREVRYEALECGATDFLAKPIDKNEFIPRVRNMLALRRHAVMLANRADDLSAAVAQATAEIREREKETVTRLARAAEFRDPETGAHIQRMAEISRLIAREIGLAEADQEMIHAAAPMHDVGKLGTPDHILLKPGRLSVEEMAVMQRHATIGYEILKDSASPVLRLAAEIAHSHHEKFDGSGYPNQLSGADIPLVGRIVAVADVFDALTSERPYKTAWPIADARAYMEKSRSIHFDPAILDAFFAVWDEVLAVKARYQD